MSNSKKEKRQRRARQTRAKIDQLKQNRLLVNRSNCHIYAQVLDADRKVLAAASSVEPSARKQLKSGSNKQAAAFVGQTVAQRAIEKGISVVAFDRSGYQYHGRIKSLAEAAREAGLKF